MPFVHVAYLNNLMEFVRGLIQRHVDEYKNGPVQRSCWGPEGYTKAPNISCNKDVVKQIMQIINYNQYC